MTRRLLSLRGYPGFSEFGPSDTPGFDWHFRRADLCWCDVKDAQLQELLPYAPGDRLWVREHCATWNGAYRDVVYRADNTEAEWDALRHDARTGFWNVRPSIFMPRWASRLTLIVEDVRLQRVQDISEDDARAEGLASVTKDGRLWKWGIPDRDGLPGNDDYGWHWQDWQADPRDAFARLWDGLNAKRGAPWSSNPWVAALTFRAIGENIDSLEGAS